jgi:hypothetical protein
VAWSETGHNYELRYGRSPTEPPTLTGTVSFGVLGYRKAMLVKLRETCGREHVRGQETRAQQGGDPRSAAAHIISQNIQLHF